MSDRSVRKQRVINATDSEWDIVRARAKAARLSASGYVVRRALSAEVSDGPSLTTLSARLERIETALLTLCEVERVRLAERGEEEGWTAALRRVAMQQRTDPTRPVPTPAGGSGEGASG